MRRITNLQLRDRTNRPSRVSAVAFSYVLRELESEVLENVALSLLIVRYLQRDFGFLAGFNWREPLGAREGLFRISNFSYCVALNAEHK